MRRRIVGGLLFVSLALALMVVVTTCHSGAREDEPVSAIPGTKVPKDPTYGVRGRVTSTEGAPIVGKMVQAESLDKPKQAIPELAVMTRADGGYWWPLRPGRYRLSVTAEGNQTVSREVVVRPNEVTRLDFSLKKNATP